MLANLFAGGVNEKQNTLLWAKLCAVGTYHCRQKVVFFRFLHSALIGLMTDGVCLGLMKTNYDD